MDFPSYNWLKQLTTVFSVLFIIISFNPPGNEAAELNLQQINKNSFNTVFSKYEHLHYTISWSGGIKIGDLYLDTTFDPLKKSWLIHARITDYGLFKMFYPVDDTFKTYVKGSFSLPYRYEVSQKEGWGSETKRLTTYDQQKLTATYKKNAEPESTFDLNGTVYNEFSSFYISRVVNYNENEKIIVPTFVDKKRHEVDVHQLGRENHKTIFGDVATIKIMPVLKFKGLYDKDGDTVYWLTDDACRIPVLINSKIAVGSLTAELSSYSNPQCSAKYVNTSSKQ